MTSGILERDGIRLRFVDTSEGRPVVFQHGLGADAGQIAEIFPAGFGARFITLECRAHGESDAGPYEKLAIATFANDVVALCERLGLRRATFGGISMGAAIAQRVATIRGDLVDQLMLVRPAWVDSPAPPNMRPFVEVAELLATAPRDEARRRFLAGKIAADLARVAPDNVASLLRLFDRPDPAATAALISRIAVDGPGTDRASLGKIAVRSLVVGTEADFVHPLKSALALHEMIAGSTLVEISPKSADLERHRCELRAAVRRFLMLDEPPGERTAAGRSADVLR